MLLVRRLPSGDFNKSESHRYLAAEADSALVFFRVPGGSELILRLAEGSHRGSLMEECLQKGGIRRGQPMSTCVYLFKYTSIEIPAAIVMLTNAEGRSKPPLCSAGRWFKCLFAL